jgi:hypothetical protein
VTDARALRHWLQHLETSARYRPAVARLDNLRNPAGEGTAWTAVIAALTPWPNLDAGATSSRPLLPPPSLNDMIRDAVADRQVQKRWGRW